jgi:hypothetical protein
VNANEIAAGVRTVTHLANYFDELKSAAAELATRVSANTRGYFTTSEEDETRAILISYWQSRNALFDLIQSIRCDVEEDDRDYPEAFVIAFAAALTLVDAARYLREVVEGRPTIRSKLNEPAPQFGIPKNVFDSIQRSLLSARHGWHLYHALQYYEQNTAAISRLTEQDQFRPLLAIIQRLKPRLDVSVAQFTKAKLRTRGDQILRRMAFNLFGRALYGLQKMAGSLVSDKYVRPGHQPNIDEPARTSIGKQLSPGDVLVVRKEYALTNYFLPGYWPHAALYLGDAAARSDLGLEDKLRALDGQAEGVDASACVLEAMKDGVHVRSMASPFASDSMVVLRPRLSREKIRQGLGRSLAHAGKPYDFDFDFRRSDRLVCTEVVYRALDGLGAVHLPLVSRAGRPTLSGSDLIKIAISGESLDPVLAFAPEWEPDVVSGSAVVPILLNGQAD